MLTSPPSHRAPAQTSIATKLAAITERLARLALAGSITPDRRRVLAEATDALHRISQCLDPSRGDLDPTATAYLYRALAQVAARVRSVSAVDRYYARPLADLATQIISISFHLTSDDHG